MDNVYWRVWYGCEKLDFSDSLRTWFHTFFKCITRHHIMNPNFKSHVSRGEVMPQRNNLPRYVSVLKLVVSIMRSTIWSCSTSSQWDLHPLEMDESIKTWLIWVGLCALLSIIQPSYRLNTAWGQSLWTTECNEWVNVAPDICGHAWKTP